MAIPINEDPYSTSFKHNSSQFYLSLENLAGDVQLAFYRPESVDVICQKTKFSKREVQTIYRHFKQVCPFGIVTKENIQSIFVEIFPCGNPQRYSDLVFRAFDNDDDGRISFEVNRFTFEFITGLSIITRGTLCEKFNWIFTLYDVHRRNCINHTELLHVVQAVHDLWGRSKVTARRARMSSLSPLTVDRADITDHVFHVFNRLCRNGEAQIERHTFVEYCLADAQICESLAHFETIF